jgi:hypothetical protein
MMTLKTFERPIVAAFLAALLTGQVACSGAPTGGSSDAKQSPAAASTPATYSGEALFRGVMFGDGEVAARLPELWGTAAVSASKELANSANPAEAAAQLSQMADRMEAEGLAADAVARIRDRATSIRKMSPASFGAAMSASADGDAATRDAVVEYIQTKAPAFFDQFKAAMESGNPVAINRAIDDASKRIVEAGSAVHAPTPLEGDVAIVLLTFVAVIVVLTVLLRNVESPIHKDRMAALMAERFAVTR